ncbi:MAG TPA: hypothetical protein VNF45_02770 [Candidatus Binataceae bacterium]|nr:hypothetical protein [Candidatus Binataceae bacterium]
MPKLTPETVKHIAAEFHECALADDAAASAAHAAGALMTQTRRLVGIEPGVTQPPFGYPTLLAEAERIRARRRRA